MNLALTPCPRHPGNRSGQVLRTQGPPSLAEHILLGPQPPWRRVTTPRPSCKYLDTGHSACDQGTKDAPLSRDAGAQPGPAGWGARTWESGRQPAEPAPGTRGLRWAWHWRWQGGGSRVGMPAPPSPRLQDTTCHAPDMLSHRSGDPGHHDALSVQGGVGSTHFRRERGSF